MAGIKNLISLREASILTGYHPDYLSQLIRGGKLHGSKIGRNWFTTNDAVTVYLASQKFVPIQKVAKTRKFAYASVLYVMLFLGALGFIAVHVYSTTNAGNRIKTKDTPVLDATNNDSPLEFSNSRKP
jgi:hypothetical protein